MVAAKDLMKTSYVKVDMNDTLSDLQGKLRLKNQTFAVVFDKKKYKGITGRKWLLTSRIDPSKTKLRNMTKRASKRGAPFFVPKLKPSTDLTEVCRLFASSDTRALPVFDKEKLVGVVTARAVMRKIKSEYKGIPVTELARKKLATIKLKDTTADAIKTMNRSKVDRLPVVDRFGRLAGIVTEFDILKRFHKWPPTGMRVPSSADHNRWSDPGWEAGEKQSMLKLPVENIMTPDPMVCCASIKCTIAEAIDLLIKDDVNSVILVDGKEPAGILTVKDVLDDYSRE
ncbi:CBS domain-containing protein [Candidatus Woesearchaeota archaeon]|nr:CBS domain-containing protein [Candidatus Woesearchaeota archaeon]MBW3005796.1 CBS domain-containing protein [Candidatus Woesearchaeota archaeon]